LIITEELSEVLGMFAADGNLQDEHMSIWGNIHEDKKYYDEIVCPLFSKVFNINVKAHEKKSNSVYGFYICNKNVINALKDFGFTKRKTYDVKIPREIIVSNDVKIISAFIRGFTDCDGCLNFMKRYEKGYCDFKKRYHTYPRIFIEVVSEIIIDEISFLLKILRIKHTKRIAKKRKANESESYEIAVRGNEMVEKWIEKIGFNNPSKKTKYLVWKEYGFCPTPSNIVQRELILNKQLVPETFYSKA
jgi:hypothetical protein